MTNEIKFRAKVKWNGNHRFSGDWIYGNLLQMPTYKQYDNQSIIDKWVWAIQEHCPHNGLSYIYETIEIDEDTICQYTGYKDTNNKEIYKKDIVEAFGGEQYYGSWEHSVHGHVVSNMFDEIIFDIEVGALEKVYVIGNEFDNPEKIRTNKPQQQAEELNDTF